CVMDVVGDDPSETRPAGHLDQLLISQIVTGEEMMLQLDPEVSSTKNFAVLASNANCLVKIGAGARKRDRDLSTGTAGEGDDLSGQRSEILEGNMRIVLEIELSLGDDPAKAGVAGSILCQEDQVVPVTGVFQGLPVW